MLSKTEVGGCKGISTMQNVKQPHPGFTLSSIPNDDNDYTMSASINDYIINLT